MIKASVRVVLKPGTDGKWRMARAETSKGMNFDAIRSLIEGAAEAIAQGVIEAGQPPLMVLTIQLGEIQINGFAYEPSKYEAF